MHETSAVPEAVTARLQHFVSARRAEIAGYGDDAADYVEAAAATLTGGKRLRARFCHAGWKAVARHGDPAAAETESLWDLCAALEVFQSAALVHDDLVDNSDTRRGAPAAHRALEAAHRRSAWSGDAAAYGRSAALLLGDLLVAWSDDLLEQALTGHPQAASVRAEYARMRRDVTLGQLLDIAEESAWSAHPAAEHAERALRVASLKSARYSVEQPIVLGASLAAGDSAQIAALRAFGHPIGIAFQLRDDVLGVFGDAAVTGKPAGDDLREGKRTVLIALTRAGLDTSERIALDGMLGDPELDDERIASLQRMIVRTGALDRVEALIADHAARADLALADAPLANAAIGELRELAAAATRRVQ